jgi:hypothetical protein
VIMSVAYLLVRCLMVLAWCQASEAELLVLWHENAVLRLQVARV